MNALHLFNFCLQGQCQPHLTETVKESVEGICLKIYHLSADHTKKILEKSREILRENGIQGDYLFHFQIIIEGKIFFNESCLKIDNSHLNFRK